LSQNLPGLLVGVLLAALGAIALRRYAPASGARSSRVALVGLGAFVLAWACYFAELGLWHWTKLSLVALKGKEAEALLAMFLFAAPLEEGAKVLAVWPLYAARRIPHVRQALVLAAAAGWGFATGEASALVSLEDRSWLGIARALLTAPPHVLSAILWGVWLGTRTRAGWFSLAWLVAMVLRGAIDHVVLGRGPGLMVLAIPLLLALLALAWATARRAALESSARTRGLELAAGRSEPPSLTGVWQALQPRQQPLMLLWIAFGALVTLGVGLAALAFAIFIGHRLGLDFAAADEADLRSNGPLLLLGLAIGAAFPAAGYLVARASGTRSVLEPALGASLATVAAVLFLSVTTPIAAVFAFAITPVAFVLTCSGAWFGISHR
jgi:RsiW-degrading membrane proteinase PrsW (M82 family)